MKRFTKGVFAATLTASAVAGLTSATFAQSSTNTMNTIAVLGAGVMIMNAGGSSSSGPLYSAGPEVCSSDACLKTAVRKEAGLSYDEKFYLHQKLGRYLVKEYLVAPITSATEDCSGRKFMIGWRDNALRVHFEKAASFDGKNVTLISDEVFAQCTGLTQSKKISAKYDIPGPPADPYKWLDEEKSFYKWVGAGLWRTGLFPSYFGHYQLKKLIKRRDSTLSPRCPE